MSSGDRTGSARLTPALAQILRHDVPASLVVVLVALPLSLGIAMASGAPLHAGLIAAAVGGILVGGLGGSPLQVSGPAAGLTVVVAGLVAQFGWAVACAITVVAGVVQVLLGLSRVARAALAVSPVVVHAMLAGIGIVIALQQVHVVLGADSQSSPWRNMVELPGHLQHVNVGTVCVGVLVIGLLLWWGRAPGWLKKFPGPLAAIVGATAMSLIIPLDVPRIDLEGSMLDALQLPGLPDGQWGAFAMGVLTMALIASVESLLCAVAVDGMHDGPRSNLDRELIGQGVANITSGTIGGLPITGVIVRSTANLAAGAKTRASAFLHGIWVLVFALPDHGLVELVPTSALAGLLVVIGIQLVKPAHIDSARRSGDLPVYLITASGVLFLDLLQGVLIGFAAAVALTAWRALRVRIRADDMGDDQWRVVIEGSCSFLTRPRLSAVLASVPPGTTVTVEASPDFFDRAAYDTLAEWRHHHELFGGTVNIHDEGPVTMASALAGPAQRGFIPTVRRPVLAQGSHDDATSAVLHGLTLDDSHAAPYIRRHMHDVVPAQRPETLFITCTDSRVVPSAVIGSEPGDLFIVRNVGNLIPAGRRDPSVEAAIALAVETMGVSSIVVCGHSGCDAMTALIGDGDHVRSAATADEDPQRWLAHGRPTLTAFRNGRHPVARAGADAGFGRADQLGMVNVERQLDTLAGHELVVTARTHRRLTLIGLFYDIPNATVLPIMPSVAR